MLLAPVFEAQLGHDLLHLVNLRLRRGWELWSVQGPYVVGVGQENDVEA